MCIERGTQGNPNDFLENGSVETLSADKRTLHKMMSVSYRAIYNQKLALGKDVIWFESRLIKSDGIQVKIPTKRTKSD